MKLLKNSLLIIILLASCLPSVMSQNRSINELAPYLKLASGTGLTTGHVANLLLSNETASDVILTVGPYYIPSNNQYQPYIIPETEMVTLPAGHTSVIELYGYCASVFQKAVPANEELIDLEKWQMPIPNNYPKTNGWDRSDNYKVNVLQQTGKTEFKLAYPGVETEFIYKIDYDKYAATSANQLLDAIIRIEDAYDQLYENKLINTPYASNPIKERESVIQQTFWIYTSLLNEKDYNKASFKARMLEQYEEKMGQELTAAEAKKQFDYGANSFWNSFTQVLKKSKLVL